MMDKLIIDCDTGKLYKTLYTQKELEQFELEKLQREEQELSDSLIPSVPTIENRVTDAEVDIVTLEETIDTIFGGI